MSLKPRYVFDTNVIVSALLFEKSVPAQAFYAALDRGDVLLSQATAAELSEVIDRPKLDRYLAKEERQQFLVALLREATVVAISEEVHSCRDPKDNKFLELAVSGTATHVISGDQDLLVLHPFQGIPILTPAQFLEDLQAGSESTGTDL